MQQSRLLSQSFSSLPYGFLSGQTPEKCPPGIHDKNRKPKVSPPAKLFSARSNILATDYTHLVGLGLTLVDTLALEQHEDAD